MGVSVIIGLMRALCWLPLPVLRASGWLLGQVLYAVVGSRRRVAMINLGLCFPQLSPGERRKLTRQVFVRFSQAALDRSWLWHANAGTVERRLKLVGNVQALQAQDPVIYFAPHFVGMDAGGLAVALRVHRRHMTIFTNQSNQAINQWVQQGRNRFGDVRQFDREDGVKAIVSALRAGGGLYLLPDMNFGASESIFVPFYGIAAATVPSLSRFARLGRAKVLPVVTRMTSTGYETWIGEFWDNFPTDDVRADTALMNQRLQVWIDAMPDQYYWVHKRFKTRPEGEPAVY